MSELYEIKFLFLFFPSSKLYVCPRPALMVTQTQTQTLWGGLLRVCVLSPELKSESWPQCGRCWSTLSATPELRLGHARVSTRRTRWCIEKVSVVLACLHSPRFSSSDMHNLPGTQTVLFQTLALTNIHLRLNETFCVLEARQCSDKEPLKHDKFSGF